MISSYTSDIAALLTRGAQLNQVKADASIAESELLSGRRENVAVSGFATTQRVQRINLDLTRLQSDQQSLTLLRSKLQTTEVAFENLESQSSALTAEMLGDATDFGSSPVQIAKARNALDDLLGQMGKQEGISGTRHVDTDALLAGVRSAISTSADPVAAMQDYFERGGAFDTQFPANPMPERPRLSDGSVSVSPTDFDTDGVRAAIEGLVSVVVSDAVQTEQFETHALERMLEGQDGLISIRTVTGSKISQVENRETDFASRATALNLERNALDGVDPYEAASRLQAYQDTLDMTLVLTKRMSDLSLARYL